MKHLLSFPIVAGVLGALSMPPVSLAHDGNHCADISVAASAIRTRGDVRAFVQCAYEYVQENGAVEAHRAFHEDERWKSGPIYVFVDVASPRGEDAVSLVFPPDPQLEGSPWGPLPDVYGNDYFPETDRIVKNFGEGWTYYSFTNPASGRDEPKITYVKAIDWDGASAVIGAGIYLHDLPGTCDPADVSAAALAAEPGADRLQELVRCAAYRFEEAGYFAAFELQNNLRWRSGSIYVFVLNSRGMQYFSSNPVTVGGAAVEEWNGSLFMERDVASPAAAFGESTLYYDALNPMSGRVQRKVAFVKRVMVGGEALLVGSGYYLP